VPSNDPNANAGMNWNLPLPARPDAAAAPSNGAADAGAGGNAAGPEDAGNSIELW
jgi:hypothetical protein